MKEKPKIALIDYDLRDARILAKSLRENIAVAAIEIFSSETEFQAGYSANDIDLYVIHRLQKLDGVSILKKVRLANPHNPCLLLASVDSDQLLTEAVSAGASGFIHKHESLQKLLKTIREVLNGETLDCQTIQKVLSLFSFGASEYTTVRKSSLTLREEEILQLLSKGLLYKEIASRLKISRDTVKLHVAHIYQKINVQNKVEAVNWYHRR